MLVSAVIGSCGARAEGPRALPAVATLFFTIRRPRRGPRAPSAGRTPDSAVAYGRLAGIWSAEPGDGPHPPGAEVAGPLAGMPQGHGLELAEHRREPRLELRRRVGEHLRD